MQGDDDLAGLMAEAEAWLWWDRSASPDLWEAHVKAQVEAEVQPIRDLRASIRRDMREARRAMWSHARTRGHAVAQRTTARARSSRRSAPGRHRGSRRTVRSGSPPGDDGGGEPGPEPPPRSQPRRHERGCWIPRPPGESDAHTPDLLRAGGLR